MMSKNLLHLFAFTQLLYFVNGQTNWVKYGVPIKHAQYLNASSKLQVELFTTRNYNKGVSPIYALMPANYSESTVPRFHVHTLLMYAKVIDLDAQSQLFKASFSFLTIYQDLRLVWDPNDFDETPFFWVNQDMVWQPENGIGYPKEINLVYPDTTRAAKIYANGTIMLANVYYAEISCPVNVGDFPFDEQSCEIPLMVFSYNQEFVSMSGQINSDYKLSQMSNGEWDVTNVTTKTQVWGSNEFIFDVFSFKFSLRRVPNFYIYVIAIPCFILTLLSVCGMFWTPNYEAEKLVKLSIGLTSLVSMTVLLQMVSEAIPKTTKFPLLGIYVVISILIIAISCVIVVVYMAKRKEKRKMENFTFCGRLWNYLYATHFAYFLILQVLNLANFIVLMSFWK